MEEEIRANLEAHPRQKFLLLRMHRVNLCDISGLHMLETIVKLYRQHGGDVFMVGVRRDVWEKMQASGFDNFLGLDHFLSQERAIEHIFYKILDPALCIYNCRVKIWQECQTLPKSYRPDVNSLGALVPATAVIPHMLPEEVWQMLNSVPVSGNGSSSETQRPLIVDIREPGEFAGGHIPHARLVPMPQLLAKEVTLPHDQQIILICRTGRRTTQVLYALQQEGYNNLLNMVGGMVAWEKMGLPVVIE